MNEGSGVFGGKIIKQEVRINAPDFFVAIFRRAENCAHSETMYSQLSWTEIETKETLV